MAEAMISNPTRLPRWFFVDLFPCFLYWIESQHRSLDGGIDSVEFCHVTYQFNEPLWGFRRYHNAPNEGSRLKRYKKRLCVFSIPKVLWWHYIQDNSYLLFESVRRNLVLKYLRIRVDI